MSAPLTAEEEAHVRKLDSEFDIGNPGDFARPDWLVKLLVERRRLLATLDAARAPAPSDADLECLECGGRIGYAKGRAAAPSDGLRGFHARITATMDSPSLAAWESIALDLFDALATPEPSAEPDAGTEMCPTCWQPVPRPLRGDHDYGIPLRASAEADAALCPDCGQLPSTHCRPATPPPASAEAAEVLRLRAVITEYDGLLGAMERRALDAEAALANPDPETT